MPAGSPPSTGARRLAPIYMAHEAGIAVHVWVDETRPRNQGAALTAWELGQHGVPHTVDRRQCRRAPDAARPGRPRASSAPTARPRNGDVCNKIGTYLKALAAHDNGVPFYVALPSPTIDWTIERRVREIPIEERDADEVTRMTGPHAGRPHRDGRDRRPGRHAGRQLRLRRHAGAAGHRPDHRARRVFRYPRRPARPLSGDEPRRGGINVSRPARRRRDHSRSAAAMPASILKAVTACKASPFESMRFRRDIHCGERDAAIGKTIS